MATYKEFEKYIKANYNLVPESNRDLMAIGFNLPNGRSQLVFLERGGSDTFGEVAQVLSFLGELTGKKLEKALEETWKLNAGGLVKIGDKIAYRCSIILADVDESEIDKSIAIAAAGGDYLEKTFTGEDNH
jgi:hypothetical protein